MVSSQKANKKFATATASRNAPKITHALETSETTMTPRTNATIPPAMRMPAKARRWGYSHGEIMRRMPDRGGDAHHPADLLQRCCHWVRSSGCLLWDGSIANSHPMREGQQQLLGVLDADRRQAGTRTPAGRHGPPMTEAKAAAGHAGTPALHADLLRQGNMKI